MWTSFPPLAVAKEYAGDLPARRAPYKITGRLSQFSKAQSWEAGVVSLDASGQVRPAMVECLSPIPPACLMKERSSSFAHHKQTVGRGVPDSLTFLPIPLEDLHGLRL